MSSEDNQNIKQQKNGKFKATVGSESETFDSFQQANDWVQEQERDDESAAVTSTNDPLNRDAEATAEANGQESETINEKPASAMTEADAVAVNADVHLAGASERIATDGEKDQVDAGLHPDPAEGEQATETEQGSDDGKTAKAVDTKAVDNTKAD
jgi:hypothetical protein